MPWFKADNPHEVRREEEIVDIVSDPMHPHHTIKNDAVGLVTAGVGYSQFSRMVTFLPD